MSPESPTQLAQRIFAAKVKSRKIAAALPIEEKLRRLVMLQTRANEIRRSTHRPLMRVWELD